MADNAETARARAERGPKGTEERPRERAGPLDRVAAANAIDAQGAPPQGTPLAKEADDAQRPLRPKASNESQEEPLQGLMRTGRAGRSTKRSVPRATPRSEKALVRPQVAHAAPRITT